MEETEKKAEDSPSGLGLAILFSGLVHAILCLVIAPAMLAFSTTRLELLDFAAYALYCFILLSFERTVCGLVSWGGARWNRQLGLALQCLLSAIVSTGLLANFLVQQRLGVQLFDPSIVGQVQLHNLGNASNDLLFLALAIGCAFLVLHGSLTVLSLRIPKPKEMSLGLATLRFPVYGLLGVGFFIIVDKEANRIVHWRSLPFGPLIAGSHQEKLPVKESRKRAQAQVPLKKRPDMVVILVESLRADMLTKDTMPNVTRFADEHHCARSAHHFSGGHSTNYGVFSLLNSVFADVYHSFAAEEINSLPLTILRKNGYRILGLSSSEFDENIKPVPLNNFDVYEEKDQKYPIAADQFLTKSAQKELASSDASRPKFLFYFYGSTHDLYSFPKDYAIFKPFVDSLNTDYLSAMTDPQKRLSVFNAYRNSVLFVDSMIGKVLEPLAERIDKGELLLAIAGDHGEEFWEHGFQGHLGASFVRERVESMMTLCMPQGSIAEHIEISHHVDILPTFLDWASDDISALAPFIDGVSLRRSSAPRTLLVTAMGFPETSNKVAVIQSGRKFVLNAQLGVGRFEFEAGTDWMDRPLPEGNLEFPQGAIAKLMSRYYLEN